MMEKISVQLGASSLELSEEGLTITILQSFWRKRQWQWLVQMLNQLCSDGLGWISAPTEARPSAAAADEAQPKPRWKWLPLDGLSYLLFGLLIPASHPLRSLYAAFDWLQIDERCATVYHNQRRGAPAYRPQVLFRVLVLMFYSGTPFESATLQRLQTDLAWRWFVGLSVLRPVPDAGTLSYFRTRLGVELFEALLLSLIQVCDEAGLIGHQESYYDMTGVEASATQVTPYQRAVILVKAMSAYLDQQQGGLGQIEPEQIAAIALEVLAQKHPSLKKVKPQQLLASQDQLNHRLARTLKGAPNWWQRLCQKVKQLGQPGRPASQVRLDQLPELAGQLLPTLPQAFGNPDAAVGHTRTDGTLCGYRSGFLVDAKHLIITAVVLVALNKPEAPTLITALEKHYALFQHYPKRLALDSAFDRDEVHRYTEKHHIDSVATVRGRAGPREVFKAEAFIWNEQGQLICPNGEIMAHVGGPYNNGRDHYLPTADCAQCPLRDQCLTAKQQQLTSPRRRLQLKTAAHQRAQGNRERSRSPQGRALRRRRFAAEGLFGHLNHFHNGDKAPYRDETMDHIAQLMVAFVSNLEKLATYA
jgi:transposase